MNKAIEDQLGKLGEKELTNIAMKIEKLIANNDADLNRIHTENAASIWVYGERSPKMTAIDEGVILELKGCRYGKRDKLIFVGSMIPRGKRPHDAVKVEISARRMDEIFSKGKDRPFQNSISKSLDSFIGQMIINLNEDEAISLQQEQDSVEEVKNKNTGHIAEWGSFA